MDFHKEISNSWNDVQGTLFYLTTQAIKDKINLNSRNEPSFRDQAESITNQLVEYFYLLLTPYKNNSALLVKLYENDYLCKMAIQKIIRTDVENNENDAFWYYVGAPSQNALRATYLELYPISLAYVLELFEWGHKNKFLNLKLDLNEILEREFCSDWKKILCCIEESAQKADSIVRKKAMLEFIVLLYRISPVNTERELTQYEACENETERLFAEDCRVALESNPNQETLKLEPASH